MTNRVKKAAVFSYTWFWYHSEFWLTRVDRRPLTFIMRDWLYPRMKLFIAMTVVWYAGVLTVAHWMGLLAAILGVLSSMLLAHLIWGTKWIEGEQEYPQYTENNH